MRISAIESVLKTLFHAAPPRSTTSASAPSLNSATPGSPVSKLILEARDARQRIAVLERLLLASQILPDGKLDSDVDLQADRPSSVYDPHMALSKATIDALNGQEARQSGRVWEAGASPNAVADGSYGVGAAHVPPGDSSTQHLYLAEPFAPSAEDMENAIQLLNSLPLPDAERRLIADEIVRNIPQGGAGPLRWLAALIVVVTALAFGLVL